MNAPGILPALRESLLLDKAEEAARSLKEEQTRQLRQLAEAAARRAAAAQALGEEDHPACTFPVYREAIRLAVGAVLVFRGEALESPPTINEACDQLESLLGDRAQKLDLASVKSPLTETNPLALDSLDRATARQLRYNLDAVLAALLSLVETRTTREIRLIRYARIGILAIAVVGALGYLITKAFSAPNLALNKPVQMSSRRVDLAPPAGLSPQGAVDGVKKGGYDICSNFEVGPWLTIDLQSSYKINKVIVYNRGDCCQGERDLPAVVDLSPDGQQWHEVGRRTTAYTESSPWTLKLGGEPARYLRVRIDSPSQRELVLSEVEVYGK
jgi:hypothetical protein